MRIFAAVLISGIVLLSGCSYINPYLGLEDDNLLEEIGEAIIENETGIDIDLSLESPEE